MFLIISLGVYDLGPGTGGTGVSISLEHLQGPRECTLSTSDNGNCIPEWLCQFKHLPACLKTAFALLPCQHLELPIFKIFQNDMSEIVTHGGFFHFPHYAHCIFT